VDEEGPAGSGDGETQVQPGALSELLKRLAADPTGTFERDWQLSLSPGQEMGRFRLLRELGRGGFGVVFEAQDTALRRKVALKAVRTGGRSGFRQERLLEEAEAAARLSHPNIVTLFDFGRTDDGPYLILELLEGETLAARLQGGALPAREAVRVAVQIARALAHAHDRGVVHRDLKPANAFLCRDGTVKVLDFGLAHAFGHKRVAGGTPAFMAPEQAAGAPEDERTDVYSLGLMLHQMLTGRPPAGASGTGREGAAKPPPPLEVDGAPELGPLVGRMTERDPLRRPRHGGEVLAALEAIEASLARAPAAELPVRTRRPRVRLAALVALALLVGGAVAAAAIHFGSGQPKPAGTTQGRMLVAVADFANETGEKELDALSRLLVTSLAESPHLDVVSRGRLADVLRLTFGEEAARIDERAGRRAAERLGAGALLVTGIARFGERYVIDLRALEPKGERALFTVKEYADRREALPELLDRISERVRLALGEGEGSIRNSSIQLAQKVTASLPAWRAYAQGLDCVERKVFAGTFGECISEFERAVAGDPGFALAHFQRSRLLGLNGAPQARQREAMAEAVAHIERLPPRDRLPVLAWRAFLDGNHTEAKRLARQAAELARDDKWLWWLAADIPYARDELAEAIVALRRVHELDPSIVEVAVNLVRAHGSTGDLEAIRALAGALSFRPATPPALVTLCHAQLWVAPSAAIGTCERAIAAGAGEVGDDHLAIALLHLGDRERLKTHLAKMEARTRFPSFAWYMRLQLASQEGRWSDVRRQLDAGGSPDDPWFHSLLAELLLGCGDREGVWRAGQRVVGLDPVLARSLAVQLAYLGDLDRAKAVAGHLPDASPRADAYRALVRWRRGDLTGAIEELRVLSDRSALSTDPAIPFPIYLYAEALGEAGRDAEAVAAFRRFLAMPLLYPSWTRQRALFFLARSLERLGDRAAAREVAGQLLAFWRRADPEQPLLAEFRALFARLALR